MQEEIVRSRHPDYDETVKAVVGDIFILDPQGNVLGVKNPSLLNYFRAQVNPHEAMYSHGLNKSASKRVPQQIKEGTQKATRETLDRITAKPKGPTMPKGGGSPGEHLNLDWNTPPDVVEKILDKRGLLR